MPRDAKGRFVSVEVDWHGEDLLLKLEGVSEDAMKALVLETEAHVKVNIAKPFEHADGENRGQIDTGAMINSSRAIYRKRGIVVGDIDIPRDAAAAVVCPAEYAAYQEAIRPFLFPAAKTVGRRAKAIFTTVARLAGL